MSTRRQVVCCPRNVMLPIILAALIVAGRSSSAGTGIQAGRDLSYGRHCNLRISGGSILNVEAMVEETTRSYYDVSGQEYKQELAETFTLDDFDMDDGYPSVGFSGEWMWRYVTLQLDTALMNPSTETVARRNYYIGVGDEISYQGRSYDNMQIPEGRPFSAEIFGAFTEVHGMFTPMTIKPWEAVRCIPWIDAGLFTFLARYEIDAGPVTGVTQYLYPPEDFAIGGSSEGFVGMALPELGVGGEVRIGGDRQGHFVVQGRYGFCKYDGSTAYLTSSNHREKDIDLDHSNYRLRCTLEVPLRSGRILTFGAQYQVVESEAMITSSAESEEEILQRRERFDKHADFKMESLMALFGTTF